MINIDITHRFKDNTNAGSKARKDVTKTLSSLGIKEVKVYYDQNKTITKIKKINYHLYFLKKVLSKILFNKQILVQYPGAYIPSWFYKISNILQKEMIFLIHDIDSIRDYGKLSNKEKWILSNGKILIVHTPAMIKKLKEEGLSNKMLPLYLFDYYVVTQNNKIINNKDSVLFCGNISKSPFLQRLITIKDFPKTFLYGKLDKQAYLPSNFIYNGFFDADNPVNIEGGWGLVWDGNNIESCDSTPLSNYLRYNTSHKISLYLILSKPLILWSASSLADWVKKKNIGIIINSLNEVPNKLKEISNEEYNEMVENTKVLAQQLKQGIFLKSIIKDII